MRQSSVRSRDLDRKSSLWALTLGALGVVFGDIGTSPLYAMRECFHGSHAIEPSADHVIGVTSLILWALLLLVSLKYLSIIFRADNDGEGGILALMSLARQNGRASPRRRVMVLMCGLFGASLLYGDGMITPAISVLSAVEGLNVITNDLEPFVIPLTIVILFFLFFFQRHGTARIGLVFGPIILVWFVGIGLLGLSSLVKAPQILAAFNPFQGISFLVSGEAHGIAVLGSVFLAVTGAEALYADMGHFGKRPIRIGWYSVAFPGLILNYLGQGALLLQSPASASNPFYLLAPRWALLPLVIMATCATVIASQALISGAFSLTSQAIQLGYLPRMEIRHTSSHEYGQIYIPVINSYLLASTVLLVLGFKNSSSLAAAYGIAVSLTMLLTTLLVFSVMRDRWKWSLPKAASIVGLFFTVEAAFMGANALKFFHGGWFPLVIGAMVFTLMTTWRRGRRILAVRLRSQSMPYDSFLRAHLAPTHILPAPHRVAGTAIFLTKNAEGVPPALLHNLRHNKVLHERVILMTIFTQRVPFVSSSERVEFQDLGYNLFRLILRFGFMERPAILPALELARLSGLELDLPRTTFFLGAETLIPTHNKQGMEVWREHVFAFMSRNAQKASHFYDIPSSQVVEVGLQVEL